MDEAKLLLFKCGSGFAKQPGLMGNSASLPVPHTEGLTSADTGGVQLFSSLGWTLEHQAACMSERDRERES